MPVTLEGRTALVTGSGGALGRSHAILLAQRGAAVVVHDIRPEAVAETAALVRKQGVRAREMVCDIRDTGRLGAAIAEAAGALGTIDILVNNAGVFGAPRLFEEIDEETYDEMHEVHVRGAFFATQAVVPGMKAQRYGKIVNISSVAAMGGSPFGVQCHYAAAKSALTGLAHSWARELAPYNIMVNAVAPGFVPTPLTESRNTPEGLKEMTDLVPLGRLGEPMDVSYAVAWLASPESDFVTGQVISPNGGHIIVGI